MCARRSRKVAALRQRGTVPGSPHSRRRRSGERGVRRREGEGLCEVGIRATRRDFPLTTSQAELLALVERLNADTQVHGILVQMPLPRHVDAEPVVHRVRPDKDVDGFHPVNVGKLLAGATDGFAPCTPAGVQLLLREYGVETCGAECVIVGRSNIVGKPLAALLMQPGAGADATVTVVTAARGPWIAHPTADI